MADGIILMTALLPTVGHERLVRFAQDFMAADPAVPSRLFLLISTRRKEPTSFDFRASALTHGLTGPVEVIAVPHDDDEAPQNPDGRDDAPFWDYWRRVIVKATGGAHIGLVFASEPYGADVALSLGAQFIPVDIAREIAPVKGTDVRRDMFRRWAEVAPAARPALTTNWVLFGQESVGKTTMARALAGGMGGAFYHEWARPYLEGTAAGEITEAIMSTIVRGQSALETGASTDGRLLRFLDTDLLSTLGYYRLWGREPDPAIWGALERSRTLLRQRYLLLSDAFVPFEADPYRYGGDRRETDLSFWKDILEEHDLPYDVLDAPSFEERYRQAEQIIMRAIPSEGLGTYEEMMEFRRD